MSDNNSRDAFDRGLGTGISLGLIAAAIVGSVIATAAGLSPANTSDALESHPTPSTQSYTAPKAAPKAPSLDTYSASNDKHAAHSIPGDTNPFLVPCKTESDNGCYWDASTSGNGVGQSYVVTQDGQVFYLDKEMSN